jgi:hypothetical protein
MKFTTEGSLQLIFFSFFILLAFAPACISAYQCYISAIKRYIICDNYDDCCDNVCSSEETTCCGSYPNSKCCKDGEELCDVSGICVKLTLKKTVKEEAKKSLGAGAKIAIVIGVIIFTIGAVMLYKRYLWKYIRCRKSKFKAEEECKTKSETPNPVVPQV